jgi:hypothetical protein
LVEDDAFVGGEEEEPRVWPLPEKAVVSGEEACLVRVSVRALNGEGGLKVGRGEKEEALTLYLPRVLDQLWYHL